MKIQEMHLFRLESEVGTVSYYAGKTCQKALSAREPERSDPVRIDNLGTVKVVESEE